MASLDCGSPLGGPTDNPIITFYGEESFAWTNEIRWQCVYNIKDFTGSTDQDRIEAARDAARMDGGGVVYLPAGDYYLEDTLSLGDGIVLRGETPTKLDAKATNFEPPTRLEFPKYEPSRTGNGTDNDTAFKQIVTDTPDTDSNQGLVFLDINRAGVVLAGDPDRGPMQNRLIFGVRSNNVAQPDNTVPDTRFQPGWLRYSNRFAANFRITVRANALVANNRINDAVTDNYPQSDYVVKSRDGNRLITYAEGDKVPFSYTDHYGIVINRSKPVGFGYGRTENEEPGLFRPGIVIQDNWIFKTMRSGIQASGQGLMILNNEIYDQTDKRAWADPTGQRQPEGSMTFENRAIDWSGHDVLIEENRYEVYRHQIMDGPYATTDGEGILIQQCCGGTSIDGVMIRNNQGQGYIGLYKVPDMQNVTIAGNEVASHGEEHPAIYVNADTNTQPGEMNAVTISRNTLLRGGILAKASQGGEQNRINDNTGEGVIQASCHVAVENNDGLSVASCLGNDFETKTPAPESPE